MKKTVYVNVRFPSDTAHYLKEYSKINHLPVSVCVRFFVEDGLKRSGVYSGQVRYRLFRQFCPSDDFEGF